jgi:hypothetical protein
MLASACVLGCGSDRVTPSLTSVTPHPLCGDGAATLALGGTGFAARVVGLLGQPAGETPTVTFAGDGSPVTLPSRWLSTTALAVDVPGGVPAYGTYDLIIANPDGAQTKGLGAFARLSAPRVDNVAPGMLCATGGDFTVTGDGFVAGAIAAISDNSGTLGAMSVSVASPTQLTAHFVGTNNFANNASLDFTVTDPSGCSGTLAGALKRKTGGGGCP